MESITAKKQPKPVIEQTFTKPYTSGDTRRYVTIKCVYNRTTKELTYGAVIWRSPLKSKEKYDKKQQKKIAAERFEKFPVVVKDFFDTGRLDEFHNNVRKQLFKTGCHAHNNDMKHAMETSAC